MEEHNNAPFTKREGSRSSVFQTQEKDFLQKLPAAQFELAQWKVATVQYNYHISVDKMQYSVPYEYIRQKVDVRLTRNTIEVFFNQNRIASHRRLYGHPGQYSTVEAHMPESHQQYLRWDGARFIQWGEKIGPSTAITVKAILSAHKSVDDLNRAEALDTYRDTLGQLVAFELLVIDDFGLMLASVLAPS